ncbi:MAG: hypothetical protein WCP77_03050 [Roseococcus sp.]
MNHHHRKVLHGIFAHPLNHNLDPKAVEHLLTELGAELHHAGSGALRITLNGAQDSLHLGEHSVGGEQVMRLRKLIGAAGVEPERDYPL